MDKFLSELSAKFFNGITLRNNVAASAVTTFGLGAPIKHLVELEDICCCADVLKTFQSENISFRVLGAGSNVVLPDVAFDDVVIRLGMGLKGFCFLDSSEIPSFDDFQKKLSQKGECSTRILCGAKTGLISLTKDLCDLGLSGLENCAGIPATLGGAIAMNAGAHGADVGSIVEKVYIVTPKGDLQLLSHSDCDFAYRQCKLPQGAIVLGAILSLKLQSPEETKQRRQKGLLYRKSTQPLHLPSAGSVFRNPGQSSVSKGTLAAGMLLEQCGLKGKREGGVEFSSMHANWLVRISSSAKTADVVSLIRIGQTCVKERFDVDLKPEVKLWP